MLSLNALPPPCQQQTPRVFFSFVGIFAVNFVEIFAVLCHFLSSVCAKATERTLPNNSVSVIHTSSTRKLSNWFNGWNHVGFDQSISCYSPLSFFVRLCIVWQLATIMCLKIRAKQPKTSQTLRSDLPNNTARRIIARSLTNSRMRRHVLVPPTAQPSELCNGDLHRPIKLQVYDYDWGKADDLSTFWLSSCVCVLGVPREKIGPSP